MDAIERGVGQLVDADMNEESTRLQALQVQQQLGIQALSIANAEQPEHPVAVPRANDRLDLLDEPRPSGAWPFAVCNPHASFDLETAVRARSSEGRRMGGREHADRLLEEPA